VSSIQLELDHHAAWASKCNLKLNPTKTSEIVFSEYNSSPPPLNNGIQRHNVIKILGVYVDNKLHFDFHINETLKGCSQTLFALKTMKNL
jgi:hypothetical protein